MEQLRVFSGNCCLCDIGHEVGADDHLGKPLHTGDIVLVYHGEYIGTDLEVWMPSGGLTVVVSHQYQSYSDGSIKETGTNDPFVMGIAGCGFDHPEWEIRLVKKYTDVVDGEHWRDYGFNYRTVSSPQPSLTQTETDRHTG